MQGNINCLTEIVQVLTQMLQIREIKEVINNIEMHPVLITH